MTYPDVASMMQHCRKGSGRGLFCESARLCGGEGVSIIIHLYTVGGNFIILLYFIILIKKIL